MQIIAPIIHCLVLGCACCVANAVVIAYLQVWRGCWEEQATHHSWSEGVPAGDEEKLQQTARESEANAGEKDTWALQAHHQTSHREQVHPLVVYLTFDSAISEWWKYSLLFSSTSIIGAIRIAHPKKIKICHYELLYCAFIVIFWRLLYGKGLCKDSLKQILVTL